MGAPTSTTTPPETDEVQETEPTGPTPAPYSAEPTPSRHGLGIQVASMPSGQSNVGRFNLPLSFETKRYAAQWCLKESIESFTTRQPVLGTRYDSDPWQVWKIGGKMHSVVSEKKTYILLFRPKKVQDAVNVLYGNHGKALARNELEGRTVAGQEMQDPGMLPEEVLRANGIRDFSQPEEDIGGQFSPSPLPGTGGATTPSGRTVQAIETQ